MSTYSVGQMNQLGVALELADFTPVEVTINCDANPHIPDGWSVEEHQKGGAFHWNAANVALH
ncbi:hypothetical protein CL631_02955, partial [bacterium]|nr:hypothetical protein [bacterium]